MFELWPFTNFHDMNLDWIIRKIRNVEDSEAAAKASEEAAADYADDAKGYMLDARSEKTQAAIFAVRAGQSADSIAGVADQVAVNTSRIDNLVANAGDTDNNAELLDIRVTYDGLTFDTAGDAVRDEAGHTRENLDEISNLEKSTNRLTWTQGRRSTGNTTRNTFSSNPVTRPVELTIPTGFRVSAIPCSADMSQQGGGSSWHTESSFVFVGNPNYTHIWLEIQYGTGASDMTAAQELTVKTDATYQRESELVQAIKRLSSATRGYVSAATGDDSTGTGTSSAPFATINKAINTGFTDIYVEPGTYTEMVNISDIESFSIQPWNMPTYSTSVPNIPMIVLDGGGTRNNAVRIQRVKHVKLIGISGTNTAHSVFELLNIHDLYVNLCSAANCPSGYMGFQVNNTDGVINNSSAYNCGTDGFNFHGYGAIGMNFCTADSCGDDGVSHHDAYTGYVHGGVFENCGKGGIATPTYGAIIEIDGAISRNNKYGLYITNDAAHRTTVGKFSNCVFTDNDTADIYINNATGHGWNNIYGTSSITASATYNEYS